jgi:cation diffusion facilitator family transporter
VAAGLEFTGDVVASTVVVFGMKVASRPPDANHPYGHGRSETLAGFVVGMVLVLGGSGICIHSLQNVGEIHSPPAGYAFWPLCSAIVIRSLMSTFKFRYGRRIQSAALVADAWNDAVDVLSAFAALVAFGLAVYNPARFLAADHYGGFVVGLFVIVIGLRVMRETSMQLIDTMPDEKLIADIRNAAMSVPNVCAVEKCYARPTGFQHHVELHIEVDPNITVSESHEIATRVRIHIREKLRSIADVLVHVEPSTRADLPKTPAISRDKASST